jgi:flagellar hook-length control protein FliK
LGAVEARCALTPAPPAAPFAPCAARPVRCAARQEASERVRQAREAKLAAVAALARADAELVAEEAAKAALVSDLNSLILQSTVQQFTALEKLESRMDGLAARVAKPEAPPDGVAVTLATASSPRAAAPTGAAAGETAVPGGAGGDSIEERNAAVQAARAEMEAAAAVAAAEARSRHVALARPRAGGAAARPDGGKLALGARSAASAPAVTGSSGGFSGFAV